MKKITKILSSVLAASMVVSAFAMNAFAASKVHELTISASKTTELAAGDTVVVEVVIDNTNNVDALEYRLAYDTNVFEIDTTKSGRDPEKYLDKTWFNEIKSTDGNWGYYFETPTYSPTSTAAGVAGEIYFGYASTTAVEADYQDNNLVVGKFNFTVKADAPNGETTLSLKGANTKDGGEVLPVDCTTTPITLTVGTPAPEKEDVVIATPAVQKSEEANGVYNAGFLADFTVDADANNPVKAVKFTVNNGEKDAETTVELGTTVEAGTVKVALNILNVATGVELTTTVAPIAE